MTMRRRPTKIGQPAERLASRRAFLARGARSAGVVALGSGVAGTLVASGASAPTPAGDIRILNYLLELEYLQEALYAEAETAGRLGGELRRYAQIAGDHEQQHVRALRDILGSNARAKPQTRFGEAVRREGRFVAAALTLEETAAAAYIGQAANLTRKRIPAVARIVAVEARHAAWIRDYAGRTPAPSAADPAKSARQVERTLARTGFVGRR
jgi:Ferritin-like domain